MLKKKKKNGKKESMYLLLCIVAKKERKCVSEAEGCEEKYMMTGEDSKEVLRWEWRNPSKGLELSLSRNSQNLRNTYWML